MPWEIKYYKTRKVFIMVIEEIWKPIKKYEQCYEISNLGRIRSLTRTVIFKNGNRRTYKTKILTPKCNMKDGYLRIILHDIDGNTKTFTMHRLVAEAFIDNPNNYPIINHIDGNKSNNCVSNLEWCTYLYNLEHARKNGLATINTSGLQKINESNKKKVAAIKNNKILHISLCSRDMALWLIENELISSSLETVSRVIRRVACGDKKTYFGLKFQYV